MRTGLQRVLIAQCILTLAATLGGFLHSGKPTAIAVLFGGLITVITTALLMWCEKRTAKRAGTDPGQNLKLMYACAIQRLLFAMVMFAVGIGVLKLQPVPLLTGFMLGQVALFLNGVKNRV